MGRRAASCSGNDFVTTVNVELGTDPGEVGDNGFTFHIADYDTGEPLEAVALRFTIPIAPISGLPLLELESTETGTWVGSGTAIAQPARRRVTVIITFSRTVSRSRSTLTWALRAKRPPQPHTATRDRACTTLSARPIAPCTRQVCPSTLA